MPEKNPDLKRRQGRKKQHATILTSTPIKDALVDKENKKKAKAEKHVNTDDLCEDDEYDVAEANNMCIVCAEFGQDNEEWYRCTSCGLRAHAECTGWDSASNYVCDMC
ncbi:hypothetical protein WA026_021408 [Henosepilachna vigintioctopunctata]|uniref:Zinc finger PHD-type domain-containing protein n=1 Tax=Henosepilachna vigintioctopunctata TaxID=420089 RepID=A0AAW1TS57_9CUCU